MTRPTKLLLCGVVLGFVIVVAGAFVDRNQWRAATACRALAYQEGARAKKIENPTMRGPLEANARRYAALAVKLEAARKASHTR